jgi:hypothetical protein
MLLPEGGLYMSSALLVGLFLEALIELSTPHAIPLPERGVIISRDFKARTNGEQV